MRLSALLVALACLTLPLAATAQAKKAAGSIELTDPAGDVSKITTTDHEYPGFDVVKMAVKSDGQKITFSATLQDPPGVFAAEVLKIYFDTDNNAKTGAGVGYPERPGFDYKAELDACATYADQSSACVGGSKAKVKTHYAVVGLDRIKGKSSYDTDTVVDVIGFPGKKKAPEAPIADKVVEATLDYADLQVKPGQTIRILVQEACGSSGEDDGYFPEILLTLK
jgi:hypothetical protein